MKILVTEGESIVGVITPSGRFAQKVSARRIATSLSLHRVAAVEFSATGISAFRNAAFRHFGILGFAQKVTGRFEAAHCLESALVRFAW